MKIEIIETIKLNGDIFFHVHKDGQYVSTGSFYAGTELNSDKYESSLLEARKFVDKLINTTSIVLTRVIWSNDDESTDD